MKVSALVHNPGAGAEKYTGEFLLSIIEGQGFECRYSSTKRRGWKKIDPDIDFLIIAGGDGTVRKVAKQLLKRKILHTKIPLAIIPLGTANNISKTLGIAGTVEDLAKSWNQNKLKKFDVGIIHGLKESTFFLEGFGYGVFPLLMAKMKEKESEAFLTLEEEIKFSLQVLHEIILSYEVQDLQLEIDGVDHSGKYLLAEVMNIRSIGPNLQLAREADPGDGKLEVVLVPESQREEFAHYVIKKLNGIENPFVFNAVAATSIRMHCDGSHVHIDDELIKLDDAVEINIELFHGLLNFFVPDKVAQGHAIAIGKS